jgi:hypothetical protein
MAEVCMGLGIGLVAQVMFGSGLISSLVQMIAVRGYREDFGLSRAFFYCKEKLFVVVLILCS